MENSGGARPEWFELGVAVLRKFAGSVFNSETCNSNVPAPPARTCAECGVVSGGQQLLGRGAASEIRCLSSLLFRECRFRRQQACGGSAESACRNGAHALVARKNSKTLAVRRCIVLISDLKHRRGRCAIATLPRRQRLLRFALFNWTGNGKI
jgi:hypothetical protein